MRGVKVKSALSALVLLGASALFAPAALAQNKAGCVQMLTGILCPQPHGGVSSGLDGEVVCGPGECVRDQKGVVKCSSVPGGSAILDINGVALCVGGCVLGSKQQCAVPTQ